MADNKEVQSPCISVCSMNEKTGFCHGCFRNMDEIEKWWDLNNQQKQAILDKLGERESAAFD
jgi:predicted Fe-S protein YdhL (DUF1289 family)